MSISSTTFSQQKFYVYLPMLEILKVLRISYFTLTYEKTYAIIYVNKENKKTIHILLTSSITFSQQKFYVYLPMLEILKVLGIGYFTNSHMKKTYAIIYVNKENKNTIHILLTSSITFSQQKFYVYLPMLEILKVLGIGFFTNSQNCSTSSSVIIP